MTTLRNVVDQLGPGLLRVFASNSELDAHVGRVVLLDESGPHQIHHDDLLLGVGVTGREREAVLRRVAAAGAAALVLKDSEGEDDARLEMQAKEAGVTVVCVPSAADWTQVLHLLSSAISNSSFELVREHFAGDNAGDLFAVANLVAEQFGAPITIEDARHRLLAFSSRQEGADTARIEAILSRAIPQHYIDLLQQRGIIRRLLRERVPIYIPDLGPNTKPRTVIAIRAGDELVGSMWLLLSDKLPASRERELMHAADFVALHVLHHRMLSDLQGRVESELLASVLQGGNRGEEASRELHVHGSGFRVVAVTVETCDVDVEHTLSSLRDRLQFQLSSINTGVRSGTVGETIYAIVPTATASVVQVMAALRRLLSRSRRNDANGRLLAGVGIHVPSLGRIPDSRSTADDVVKVLRTNPHLGSLAAIEDVRWRVLLMRFAETCSSDLLATGPVEKLLDHDLRRNTAYYRTLCAYLDAFGNIQTTASALKVHPNTIRYRLRQISELSKINLDDPTERVGLMLQLAIQPAPPPIRPVWANEDRFVGA